MIWKKEHITPQNDLYSYSQTVNKTYSPPAEAHTVAIVGGGPKGMYAVNHFANQMHLNPTTRHYELLWFNQDEYFACGPNYHIHQPDYLLINYCIGHVQAFHPAYRKPKNFRRLVEHRKDCRYHGQANRLCLTRLGGTLLTVGRYGNTS